MEWCYLINHSIVKLLHQPPESNTYRFKYGDTIGSDVSTGSDSKTPNQSGTQITETQIKAWWDLHFVDNHITYIIIIWCFIQTHLKMSP